ncbi:MAG: cytochrome c oxidase accessory protein CcoG [Saprospirales bacterium]|nr:cytochrome c oxidase accessory protein CcoG [Saprospirales bacterium]MBK8489750.1 cytochrome c oxidase accessory protein CcoG [Saprospirales bacterium]
MTTDNTPLHQETDEEFRDKIATVDDSGKRLWVFPKKPKGRFTNARIYLSFFLLVLLFGIPFIKVHGDPIMLFNIIDRKFILFGIQFMPQDFHLFVLAMLTLVLFIALFTVVFGRIFCGWICPQTIFMEMVFRRIEYWIEGDYNQQRKLTAAPWNADKVIKRLSKHAIFFFIAILVSNTFLAWVLGVDEVIKIATEPVTMHMGGFVSMILFSFAFYFVFAYLREQVCVAICPYGRLQGVLLGRDSIVIAYDFIRGEPRGKIRKSNKTAEKADPITAIQTEVATIAEPKLGDCIDCKLCVHVCPTGIDIRNGTQLECVNCTACIDACDEVMDKVDRPRGLIRYDSYNGIVEGRTKIFTPRVIAYSVVLTVLLIVNFALLGSRTDVETILLRTPGKLFQVVDEQTISNLYNYQVINKTTKEMPIEFRLVGEYGTIKLIGKPPVAQKGVVAEGALFIEMPKAQLKGRKNELTIEVYSNGELIDHTKTNFFGPGK